MNSATVPIELTRNEAMYLSDALSFASRGPREQTEGAYPTLLLKIGAAFLESAPEKPPVTVHFTPDELWMLREVSKSGVALGTEKVGLNLLTKVYAALLSVDAAAQVESAVSMLGETETDEPNKASYREQLERLRKQQRGWDPAEQRKTFLS